MSVLGETVTWLDMLGGVLVVACLLLDTTATTRADKKEASPDVATVGQR